MQILTTPYKANPYSNEPDKCRLVLKVNTDLFGDLFQKEDPNIIESNTAISATRRCFVSKTQAIVPSEIVSAFYKLYPSNDTNVGEVTVLDMMNKWLAIIDPNIAINRYGGIDFVGTGQRVSLPYKPIWEYPVLTRFVCLLMNAMTIPSGHEAVILHCDAYMPTNVKKLIGEFLTTIACQKNAKLYVAVSSIEIEEGVEIAVSKCVLEEREVAISILSY